MGTPDTNTDSLSTNASTVDNSSSKAPEEVDYKALYEIERKRAKDNQAAFTKSRQEVSILKKETQILESKLQSSILLPAEQQEELDALKYDDPDAWYLKKGQYEQNVLAELQKQKDEAREIAIADVQKQTTEDYIGSWLLENPEVTIDQIKFDVPPRIHNAYEAGTLSIDEYLEKSKEYLTNGKRQVKKADVNDIKDLNRTPGGNAPTPEAVRKQQEADSKLEIF
jgi:hypothetical protein